MSLAGCQIDVSCYLKKVWKFLIQIQLTKSDPKKNKGWKVPSFMPIRAGEVTVAFCNMYISYVLCTMYFQKIVFLSLPDFCYLKMK